MNGTIFKPHGKHLMAGKWVATTATFLSEPAHGSPHAFSVGTPALVSAAAEAAEEAFWTYGYSSRGERAAFLNAIADEIETRADAITEIGTQETGLPPARLQGERGRTTGQLRLFASHILKGDYLDRRHDPALPDRQPLPRPDLKLMQRPIGPVAVFGASNFPLAFSTAGGDTAAALAAGCPVVVKGHSAHPGTGEIVAEAVHAAIAACDLHPGVFSLIQGGKRDVGQSSRPTSARSRRWGSPDHWPEAARSSIFAREGPSRFPSSESLARSTRCSSCPPRLPRAVLRSRRVGPDR